MKKRTKIILSLCLAVLLVIGIGGYAYVSDYYHADEIALEAMAYQTDSVQVEQDGDVIWFVPEDPTAGLIFYPGGKVEHTAYAPLMRACAEQGILCALVRMPGNLAVLDTNAADGLQEEYPEVTTWYIAGHSLGGAMAANYAAAHSENFAGLILLAAYSTKDLTQTTLRVLSVYGSEDGVMNRESYEKNRANLPADTTEVVLDGGCHAQFGSYGPQDGDGVPTISGEEQIRQTAEAIAVFVSQ
ncbi:alpha/beta hydrolase [Pseudoflavonifractor phocaeensis]|uniref:alpha/beta hydrolase n=1 Tax=Pseudoflavonifractor phocaeensis TaxID=1870988 RepID=UPI001F2B50EA|nr:alpha/beta hydrolase [Pseudoflavonifractor phocaeensis]MCF2595275.1 alpha/beta hydrolase [Pseudoflavonifractor phocaeensis]